MLDPRFERVEGCRGDLLRSLDGEAPREDGEPPEDALLVGREPVVAPVDRRPQRLLARGEVAWAAGQEGRRRASCSRSALRAGRSSTWSGGGGRCRPKTVEANLARVYTKVGIRSRAELGGRRALGTERAS